MGRTSHAAAQAWRERVEAQRASGLSIRAWCKANNCHEHAFYLWRNRLGLSPASATRRRKASPAAPAGPIHFAEIVAGRGEDADRVAAESIRLRLGGGRELVVPASMPVTRLAQLIRAIEGRPSLTEGHGSITQGRDSTIEGAS